MRFSNQEISIGFHNIETKNSRQERYATRIFPDGCFVSKK